MKKLTLTALCVAALAAVPAMSADAAPLQKKAQSDNSYKGAPMRIGIEEDPNETWSDIGDCIIRDDLVTTFYMLSGNYEFTARIAESDQTPGRYRIYNAYENFPFASEYDLPNHEHYFVLDASDPEHVMIERGCLGLNLDGWEYAIWNIAEDLYHNKYYDWDDVFAEEGRTWGTLEDGAITFPAGSVLIHYVQPPFHYDDNNEKVLEPDNLDGEWTLPSDGWRRGNGHGLFRIKLPGAPNYDVLLGEGTHTNTGDEILLNFNMQWAPDVAYAYVGLAPVEKKAQLIADLSEGNGTRISGENRDQFGNIAFTLPYEGDGKYAVAVVPFSADGDPKTAQVLETEFTFDQSVWRNCGEVDYREAVLCSYEYTQMHFGFYGIKEEEYKCGIDVNMQEPGKFRLVDPYKNHSLALEYDDTQRYYMVIDATDPECVHIEYTEDGIGMDLGYGNMYIWSRANRSFTSRGENKDDVMAEGTNGTFDYDNGLITMPANSMLFEFSAYPGNYYWANINGRFRVKLNADVIEAYDEAVEATNGVHEITDENAPVEYYNLQGIRIAAPENGIYIERQGSKSAIKRF